ncbi:MAG TPA: hypothetical protein VJT12_06490 [Methyloceanibacter sp.]|nr:hypothetical protein [Methyloceanibacter sp.]
MRLWRFYVSGSRSILKIVRRKAALAAPPKVAISSGMNSKLRLLLLCARIGYTPHACF